MYIEFLRFECAIRRRRNLIDPTNSRGWYAWLRIGRRMLTFHSWCRKKWRCYTIPYFREKSERR